MSLIRKFYYLQEAKINQWKSLESLKKIQLKRLKKIINHAYHTVPFYNSLFKKAKIKPEDIKTIKDLNKIPIISKADIKNNFPDKIVSKKYNLNYCRIVETSGSTGISLKIAYDKRAEDFSKAINLRSYMSNGLKYFDNWVIIVPPEVMVKSMWFQKIGFLSPKYISIFDPLEKKIELLKKYKPRIIDSLPTELFIIAKYIKKNNIKGIYPKYITTNGEILDNYTRNYLEEVFKANVSDLFGCMELNRTAWECPKHEGYHIDIDSVVMQFIKNGEEVSSGERGEIVYTGLFNYAMPLIRYNIGDIGIPSDEMCSCGRGLPLMKIVEGKLMDFLLDSKGNLISPHIPKRLLAETKGIEKFKLVQYNKNKLEVNIVKDKYYSDKIEEELIKKLKNIFGVDVNIKLNFVDEIKRKGRKYKVIESKVSIKI